MTILTNFQNFREQERSTEATEWRDLLTSIQHSEEKSYSASDPILGPQLASFFGSDQFRPKAISVATRMLGRISDWYEFKELFGDLFKIVYESNIRPLLEVANTLAITRDSLENRCLDASRKYSDNLPDYAVRRRGVCNRYIHDDKLVKIVSNSQSDGGELT